uniref:Toxin CcdB n=1 Tax=Candidatus Kentrum sp. DK TaxID=2126562 RepID=A0A450RWG5_9GAMM|nr:MAG: toxin CcdB [Candidatus Kentron sp. DK]VFJ52931.1 MAG: toxin CcdB [Candidatus Kentron sp. DK]
MSQFTLYKNEDDASNAVYPYFINVQNPLFRDLNSRLVIPLSRHEALDNTNAKRLCPIIYIDAEIDTGKFVLLTHQMTSVPKSLLRTEVTSLESFRYEILAAVDMLISGI